MGRLAKAIARHGITGLPRLVLHNLVYHARRFSPARLRARAMERAFDRRFGTDTAGIREISSLDPAAPGALHAVQYQATNAQFVERAIRAVPLDPAGASFVDYGSGKGRVVLVAATFPFRTVCGVELFRELHEIAERNITRFRPAIRAAAVASQCIDATTFEPPDDPLIAYFYNPFAEVVLRAVAKKIEASLARRPREAYVVYVDPRHRIVFDESKAWTLHAEIPGALIYRASGAA